MQQNKKKEKKVKLIYKIKFNINSKVISTNCNVKCKYNYLLKYQLLVSLIKMKG